MWLRPVYSWPDFSMQRRTIEYEAIRIPRNRQRPPVSFVALVSCPRNTRMSRRRSVGCFSRRSEPDWRYRRAYLDLIRTDPPRRRKNSQLAAAQRVAMKMGRRLRCSSATYQFKIRALLVPVRLGSPCWRPSFIATKHARMPGARH